MSVLSPDPDTTRRPSGEMATLRTYDEHTSSQKYSGRRATHPIRVPFQRRHAFAGRHVPDLERVVPRPRHDAPPVRKHGNAIDLRRRHIITKVQRTPRAALLSSALSASALRRAWTGRFAWRGAVASPLRPWRLWLSPGVAVPLRPSPRRRGASARPRWQPHVAASPRGSPCACHRRHTLESARR